MDMGHLVRRTDPPSDPVHGAIWAVMVFSFAANPADGSRIRYEDK